MAKTTGEDGASSGVRRHGAHARSPAAQRAGQPDLPADSGKNESLTGRASRAFGWTFFSTVLTRGMSFATGIVLARLLVPTDFGLYAVAFVALLAMQTFNELGVSLAIVRWESDPSEIIPTVSTISVSCSFLIFVVCYFAAPAYSAAMGAPTATTIVRVLAIGILIDGFANTANGVLDRNFRQRQRMIAAQAGGWLGTFLTIGLAWDGFGAMSLAIGHLVGAILSLILFIVYAPESLRFGYHRERARALVRFGVPLAGSRLVLFAVTTVDQVVIGHMLGTTELGYYVLAVNMASWPLVLFSAPLSSVAPAVFSRLQRNPRMMRTIFLSLAGLLGAVALPMCLAISGSARPLVGFIYGAKWLPSARPLLWLAALAAVKIFLELSYDYFVVLARSRFVLLVQVAWLVALVPALIAGTHAEGIYGASLAEAAVGTLVVFPLYLGGLATASIRLGSFFRRLALPVLGGLVVLAAASRATTYLPGELPPLLVAGALGLAVIALLVMRARPALALIRDVRAEAPLEQDETVQPAAQRARAMAPRPVMPSAALASASATGYHDITATMPIYRIGTDAALDLLIQLSQTQQNARSSQARRRPPAAYPGRSSRTAGSQPVRPQRSSAHPDAAHAAAMVGSARADAGNAADPPGLIPMDNRGPSLPKNTGADGRRRR